MSDSGGGSLEVCSFADASAGMADAFARADLIVLRGPELELEDVLVGGESALRG